MGQGRPIGTTGPRPERTSVTTWKPRHDRIVMLHLANYSNIEIGRAVKLTPERVGQILLDSRAQVMIAKARENMVSNVLGHIDGKLYKLVTKSLDNLEKTVNARIKVSHPMKRHQDKVGIDLLKMIGYGEKEKNKDKSSEPLSNDTMDRLTRALERSQRVAESQEISVQKQDVA